MSQNKIVFLILGIALMILLLFGFFYMQTANQEGGRYRSNSNEFNIWIIGGESEKFKEITDNFKKKYSDYDKIKVSITKFANYEDYEQTLLSVMADGNSPDIFMVNNNGSALFESEVKEEDLESKILGIPKEIIHPDVFLRDGIFNPVFEEMVAEVENEEGEKIKIVKGVPLGYETLATFFHKPVVDSVPQTWSEIEKLAKENNEKGFSLVGLGYGKKTFLAPHVFAALLLQFDEVNTYKNINKGGKALSKYLSYSDPREEFSLHQFRDEMTPYSGKIRSTLDLFTQKKVGIVFGYPSSIQELEYAHKRNGFSRSKIYSAPFPQIYESSDSHTNLINYYYFAISRHTNHPEMGYAFLQYLTTEEAHKTYLNNFPYTLPALTALEEDVLESGAVNDDFPNIEYRHFLVNEVRPQSFNMGIRSAYEKKLKEIFDEIDIKERKNALDMVQSYVACKYNHFVLYKGYETSCDHIN